jgi:hypothetical protein
MSTFLPKQQKHFFKKNDRRGFTGEETSCINIIIEIEIETEIRQ